MTERWRYVVPCANAVGERRSVLVELTASERLDALRHLALRGPRGPGGDSGPIVRGYASRHAEYALPEFVPLCSEIARTLRVVA
jgi:hypothetical protein